MAARGRPYTYGQPLPLPPLDVMALIDRLRFPCEPMEALEVMAALDDVWLEARKA